MSYWFPNNTLPHTINLCNMLFEILEHNCRNISPVLIIFMDTVGEDDNEIIIKLKIYQKSKAVLSVYNAISRFCDGVAKFEKKSDISIMIKKLSLFL